jgi:hypothetical protein
LVKIHQLSRHTANHHLLVHIHQLSQVKSEGIRLSKMIKDSIQRVDEDVEEVRV